MDRSPNKRKSLAKANTTPFKIQKTSGTPVSQKKNNKSPKFMNKTPKTTPQNKQTNGKQNSPKGNNKSKQTEEDEEDDELFNDSEENDSNNSIEQAENSESNGDSDNSDAEVKPEESDEDDGVSDEQTAVKTNTIQPNIADRKFSVYVGGLNYETTEATIRSHFNDDSIVSLMLIRNPSDPKKSKGYAFVNFIDESSREKALLKNETVLDGRTIKVSVQKKSENSDGVARKQKILKALKQKVHKLEQELHGLSKNKKEGKKGFNKKNFGNKKTVKQV